MSDAPHGTRTRYQRYGCRCQPCRDACAEYTRQYRYGGRGSDAVKVNSKAIAAAIKLFRAEHPNQWCAILDQAWIDVTGHPKRQPGRPRNV